MVLDLEGDESIESFVAELRERFGSVRCLVNNAAIAFKAADPTPFEGQTSPTLRINFFQTLKLTEAILPMMGDGSRLVNVASMAGRLGQVCSELQQRFSDESLTLDGVRSLGAEFVAAVEDGNYVSRGWSKSNYGVSKLCLIAATKVLAREHPGMRVNCCCPGGCRTDMSSGGGNRSAEDGAKNAVMLCLDVADDGPTGQFFRNYSLSEW
eukprot:TRINITY_DN8431_c0_g1_i1.p2 TRINITY_DN8431_c0_g1~~TRINITY_DN8431_c0_g1_i1.p2  ORF type:complete len:210 (+),score=58.32 TRINITY_DN8431_c0_g1_i1:294-923(+)